MDRFRLTAVFPTNSEKEKEIGEQFYVNIVCESFEETRRQFHVNNRVLRYANDPRFSEKIRQTR